jgi:hypothetical protein
VEQSFADAIAQWSDFHTFLGSAAFTLLGLLFVALSLRLNIFHRRELADVRDFALLTFANFFVVMLIALLFLIPAQQRAGVAVPLGVMGALGLFGIVLLLREARRVNQGPYALTWWRLAWFGCAALPYGALIVIAAALLNDETRTLYLLAAVEVSLIAISTFNTWALLSRAQPEGDADAQGGSS